MIYLDYELRIFPKTILPKTTLMNYRLGLSCPFWLVLHRYELCHYIGGALYLLEVYMTCGVCFKAPAPNLWVTLQRIYPLVINNCIMIPRFFSLESKQHSMLR